ncbi:MAG TPA: hypothetical protein VLR50_01505 [Desulfobacterales bacterium]|nr:hypothetical protein [Desulfobacterales bacterium]
MQHDPPGGMSIAVFALALLFTDICFAATPCGIDDEEYAVYSAVLFPETDGGQQVSVPNSSDLLRTPSSLAGIWPGPYAVSSSTMTISAKVSEGKDTALLKNFNRKNTQACQIEGSRLTAALPKHNRNHVHVSYNAETKKQENFAGGLIQLSRVGFNQGKTEAVVEVHAIYDSEAGIGYRVFLQKTASDGKWRVQDVVKTRQF